MLAKPRYGVILRTAVLAVMCALLVAGSVVQAQGDPRFGGVLRVAVPGDPPMLDIQYTTPFLGVGIPPYIPSLGTMISAGRVYIQLAPWMTIFPGLAVVLLVLGLNLIGDGLRDMLDPRLRNLG